IMRMLRLGGGAAKVVLDNGSLAVVEGRLIAFSAETARLFEQTTAAVDYVVDGATARAASPRGGWVTYNFEVEALHTYIAGGVRVHNDSGDDDFNSLGPNDFGLGISTTFGPSEDFADNSNGVGFGGFGNGFDGFGGFGNGFDGFGGVGGFDGFDGFGDG